MRLEKQATKHSESYLTAHFQRRMGVGGLHAQGWGGQDVRVAVLDSGIDARQLPGAPPVWEQDFTADKDPGDRGRKHGTFVATCVRRIAPECDIVNAKVVSRRSDVATSKSDVAAAIKALVDSGSNIINVSLGFPSSGCAPAFKQVIADGGHPQIIEFRHVLDRSTACVLCQACWDATRRGVAVIVAAGNDWGRPTECPGRAPGVTVAEAVATKADWDDAWESHSQLRRWWDWKFTDRVARNWGTSFSAGYASGLYACLWPEIEQLGWLEAHERLSYLDMGESLRTAQLPEMMLTQIRSWGSGERIFDMLGVADPSEAKRRQDLLHALTSAAKGSREANRFAAIRLIASTSSLGVDDELHDRLVGFLRDVEGENNATDDELRALRAALASWTA